ncbi:hypothetical protein AnigIFM56816_004176 [Aspergillus niger]|nr:hypothetical protein AnigIFM56816_004176 [Aspergillus niger]
MVERFSIEQISASSKQESGMSKTKTFLFTILITLLSLCTAAALIVASIAMKKTQELEDFRSSLFISDLERMFNSTAYAIANSGPDAPACHDYAAEAITGQTTLPGNCVSRLREDSYSRMYCCSWRRPIEWAVRGLLQELSDIVYLEIGPVKLQDMK